MIYKIPYKKVRAFAKAPFHAHKNDAGYDISVSTVSIDDNGKISTYGCGLAFDFSSVGYALVYPRSSVWKRGLLLSNGAGVIDGGYRGEVTGVFYSMSESSEMYKPGERFAQFIFPTLGIGDSVEFVEVDKLSESSRGAGGYGSTGR